MEATGELTTFEPVEGWRPQRMSFSLLSAYQKCPRSVLLRRVYFVPERPQGNLLFGQAVHRCIEEAERVGWWQDEDSTIMRVDRTVAVVGELAGFFLDEFDRTIARAGCTHREEPWHREDPHSFEDPRSELFLEDFAAAMQHVRWAKDSRGNPKDYGWCRANGPKRLQRYASMRREDEAAGLRVTLVEAEMPVDLGDDLPPVTGRLDCAVVEGERAPRIRDWKEVYVDPFQLANYAVLYTRSIGKGEVVTEGEFARLGVSTPEKRVLRYDLRPWLDLVIPKYRMLAEKLLAERHWDWEQSPLCTGCTVRDFCPWGRTLPMDEVVE